MLLLFLTVSGGGPGVRVEQHSLDSLFYFGSSCGLFDGNDKPSGYQRHNGASFKYPSNNLIRPEMVDCTIVLWLWYYDCIMAHGHEESSFRPTVEVLSSSETSS